MESGTFMSLMNVQSAKSHRIMIESTCTSHTCCIECDMAVAAFDMLCNCNFRTHIPHKRYSICLTDTISRPKYRHNELSRARSYEKYHGRSPRLQIGLH